MPEWKDRLLEFAYTLYVDGQCSLCGGPRSECRNDENHGAYEVADTTCHKQAAIDEHTGQKGFKADPGQRFYAVAIDDSVIQRRTFPPLVRNGANNADREGDKADP